MMAILKSFFRLIYRLLGLTLATLVLAAVSSWLVTDLHARSRLTDSGSSPVAPVAIVFGAGLRRDGSASPVLRDRVATAVQLYQDGKVKKLLMSGDNTTRFYNEPAAMQEVALALGVPAEDIVLDFAGRRTYDTCYRARTIFGVEEALLVTQSYHLPRALYTCNALAVSAMGVSADRRPYRSGATFYWSLREIPATTLAFWELYISRPKPVLGAPEPIFGQEGPGPVAQIEQVE